MITDDLGCKFAALQGHQHSAARECVDERSGVANCQQSFRGRDFMPAKTFEGYGEPGRNSARVRQSPGCALILADDFAHHALDVRAATAHVTGGRDETEIAVAAFDVAQSAVAA